MDRGCEIFGIGLVVAVVAIISAALLALIA
jgi:hypothetical protein